jgi:hypothetical protein
MTGKPVKPPRIRVTDHVLVRYLERVHGYDMEALRRNIARRLQPAADAGATSLIADGVIFVIGSDDGGPTAITVLLKNRDSESHLPHAGRK